MGLTLYKCVISLIHYVGVSKILSMRKLFLAILLLPFFCAAQLSIEQQAKIDSLQEVIKKVKHDTLVVAALFEWDNLIYLTDSDLDLKLSLKIDSICTKNLVKKLNEKERSRFLKYKTGVLSNLGLIYKGKGNYSKSIDCFAKTLNIYESIGDENGIAASLNNIGLIYLDNQEYSKAMNYLTRSLKIKEKRENKRGIASTLINIGIIYQSQGEFSKSLDSYFKSLKIYKENGNKNGIAISLNYIGTNYVEQKDNQTGMKYYTESLTFFEDVGNKSQISNSLINIGNIHMSQANLAKALLLGKRGLSIAQEVDDVANIRDGAELLWKVNKKLNKAKESLEMHELYIVTRDSLDSESNGKALIRHEYKYAYEKKAAADSIKMLADNKVKDAILVAEKIETKRQQIISISIAIGLGLTTLFLMFIYRRLQVTKKQKDIIEQQRLGAERQKQELSTANEKLEEVSKEVRDSINYAELIQTAVLPTLRIEDLAKESFIYFNPKEKVSGDFYWIEQKDEYHGYAVADCTGHGIPGAFISMIGTILLNEIYNSKQIYVPNEILDELSRLVRLTLTNKDGYTMKDGMDISFAVLDNKTKMLYFSGANNPIWIASKNSEKRINKETAVPLIEKDGKYIYEIKGDKQPVGDYGEHVKPFTLNSAHLEEGDVFYLFTDGYVDQFGGNKNKKFKAKPFRELLLSAFNEEMEDQKFILDQNFQNWKGDFEQIDDVTVMGVRV